MFSNFNSAAKITTFQLQHGFTKIKPKQSKQNPSKLILKRNSFSQTGLELLNYSWPAASHPRVMRVSKFSLAGKPYLHNNKYQKWLLFSVLDAHTPPLQQLSQPAEKISIRIEITGKIHMLRLPRLVDLPHPKYQNGWFFQGKLLWTWKVDKHCNLFLFYCNIRYPKSSYQSRTVTQNHLLETQIHNALKFKFLHESGGEEWLCQDPPQLGPTWPITKPIQAASSAALLAHSAAAALQRLQPDQELQVRTRPGDTTPGRGHPCSQSHGTNLVLQPKFTNSPASSSLSVLTLWPSETIALALVTATGIRTTAKIRILWGNPNENNPLAHEKAKFLLLVECSSQRPREPSILLSYKNYSSHNKGWKT